MVKKKSNQAPEKVEEVEAVEESIVEPVEEVKAEEPKVKGFKNNSDKGIKIKLVDGKKFKWITVKPGDIVTIPRKIALANKLEEVK